VLQPNLILEVKRRIPAWVARLKNEGWNEVHCFSIAQTIQEILQHDPRRALWLMADGKEPQNWQRTNESLTNALQNGKAIQIKLEALLQSLEGRKDAIVLVTDLEALHPYLRIGRSRASSRVSSAFTRCFFTLAVVQVKQA